MVAGNAIKNPVDSFNRALRNNILLELQSINKIKSSSIDFNTEPFF